LTRIILGLDIRLGRVLEVPGSVGAAGDDDPHQFGAILAPQGPTVGVRGQGQALAGVAAGKAIATQVALAIAEGLLAGLLGGGVAGEAERATVDLNLDILGLQAVEGNFKDVALGG
jgi:hypothetical protein